MHINCICKTYNIINYTPTLTLKSEEIKSDDYVAHLSLPAPRLFLAGLRGITLVLLIFIDVTEDISINPILNTMYQNLE